MDELRDMIEFGAFLFTVMVAGFGTWIGVIQVKRWQRGSEGASRRELGEVNDRLARIEAAVETMAVEVERVAEAQRFSTRLLAERNGVDGIALPSAPGARVREAAEPR